jgi:hypothetical protein
MLPIRRAQITCDGLFSGCFGMVSERQSHLNGEVLYAIELDEDVLGYYRVYVAEGEFEYV